MIWLGGNIAWGNDSTKVIKGYVLNKDGTPLPGVRINWDREKGLLTDGNGFFEIIILDSVNQLKANCSGFNELTHKMERPNDIQVLVMTPATQLKEVVVKSGGIGRIKGVGIANTESITAQGLTRAACCNLSESFVTNPSVDVSYSDAVTGSKQIKLLGLNGTYVQMLTENFPNLRGAATPYGLDYIPGPWMQSIMISKGAASVRNGYEGITGQINVEYKKPKVADPLFVNLFASSEGRYEANAIGSAELNGRLSTAVFANYYNEERSHDDNGDSFLDMPKMQSFNAMNRWHYQTPRTVTQAGVKFMADRRTGGQVTHNVVHENNTTPYTTTNNTNRIEAFAKSGFILNSKRNESVAIIVSGSYHGQQSSYGTNTYDVYETHIYTSLLYESEFGKKHKLAAGINFNHDNYEQRGNVVKIYCPQWTSITENTTGGYAEYTWTPANRFTLVAGVRADHSSLHNWFATPRMHIKYEPTPWLTLRGSAGKGYRSSFVLPEKSHMLASNRTWHIANELKQESAWNYGVAASLRLPINGKDLAVNAEWFYTDFDNQVVTDLDRDAHSIYFYNLAGRSTSSIFQIDATYPLFRGFTLLGAYRWMDVECDYDGQVRRKPLTSRYKGLITASYETKLKKWQFDLTVQFNGGGRMPTPDTTNPQWATTFPSFTLLNAQVTRRFRRWSIYAGGENLTNFKQGNPIISANDPYGADFDATMVWGPTMGYKLYAGIRYNIPKTI